MNVIVWRATAGGRQPVPGIASPSDHAAIQNHYRGGDIVIVTRALQPDVFVDVVAQSADDRWAAKLGASLEGCGPACRLHVLDSNTWLSSDHAVVGDLLARLAGWIRLAGHAVRRSYRFGPVSGNDPSGYRGIGALPDNHQWLETLLNSLSGATVGSAREICDLAGRHRGVREAVLVTVVPPGPDHGPAIDRLDCHYADIEKPGIALPDIFSRLMEVALTKRVIVTEATPSPEPHNEAIVVLPTAWRIAEQQTEPAVAAIRFVSETRTRG